MGHKLGTTEPTRVTALCPGEALGADAHSTEMLHRVQAMTAGFASELDAHAVSVGCGLYHTCVVMDDGDAFCFGKNDHGQLGTGEPPQRLPHSDIPRKVPMPSAGGNSSERRGAGVPMRATGCACGYYHTAVVAQAPAIDDEEEDVVNPLLAQAAALTGGAAPGKPRKKSWRRAPRSGLTGGAASMLPASAGDFGADTVGRVVAWGHNRYGQLGLGHVDDVGTPQPLVQRSGMGGAASLVASALASGSVASVACGAYFTMCVTTEGLAFSWGQNAKGQLGKGTTEDGAMPARIDRGGARSGGAGNQFMSRRVLKTACGFHHVLCLTGSLKAGLIGRHCSRLPPRAEVQVKLRLGAWSLFRLLVQSAAGGTSSTNASSLGIGGEDTGVDGAGAGRMPAADLDSEYGDDSGDETEHEEQMTTSAILGLKSASDHRTAGGGAGVLLDDLLSLLVSDLHAINRECTPTLEPAASSSLPTAGTSNDGKAKRSSPTPFVLAVAGSRGNGSTGRGKNGGTLAHRVDGRRVRGEEFEAAGDGLWQVHLRGGRLPMRHARVLYTNQLLHAMLHCATNSRRARQALARTSCLQLLFAAFLRATYVGSTLVLRLLRLLLPGAGPARADAAVAPLAQRHGFILPGAACLPHASATVAVLFEVAGRAIFDPDNGMPATSTAANESDDNTRRNPAMVSAHSGPHPSFAAADGISSDDDGLMGCRELLGVASEAVALLRRLLLAQQWAADINDALMCGLSCVPRLPDDLAAAAHNAATHDRRGTDEQQPSMRPWLLGNNDAGVSHGGSPVPGGADGLRARLVLLYGALSVLGGGTDVLRDGGAARVVVGSLDSGQEGTLAWFRPGAREVAEVRVHAGFDSIVVLRESDLVPLPELALPVEKVAARRRVLYLLVSLVGQRLSLEKKLPGVSTNEVDGGSDAANDEGRNDTSDELNTNAVAFRAAAPASHAIAALVHMQARTRACKALSALLSSHRAAITQFVAAGHLSALAHHLRAPHGPLSRLGAAGLERRLLRIARFYFLFILLFCVCACVCLIVAVTILSQYM